MTAASKRSKKALQKSAEKEAAPAGQTARNIRETIESIVVAFVLAFLFRTFEAEAFVIPTGSMAPTLMGRHKDVDCPKCGYRYQASASHEEEEAVQQLRARLNGGLPLQQQIELRRQIANYSTVAATCPMCRWTQPVAEFDAESLREPDRSNYDSGAAKTSFSGDRIIVSKLAYTFSDPQRWDVVVFRYPGEAQQNYIKRMIGLPGESIRIYGGDIFVKPPGAGNRGGTEGDGFGIARKPPYKLLAMMQAVHDTQYFPRELREAGWPFRWSVVKPAGERDESAWKSHFVGQDFGHGENAVQQFSTDGSGKDTSWIRYRHIVPDYDEWLALEEAGDARSVAPSQLQPQLITDFYAYNSDLRFEIVGQTRSLKMPNSKLGLHWVGDLILECDVKVEAATGTLLLDLVEGGKHFRCAVDLKSGKATVNIVGVRDFAAEGETPVNAPGAYQFRFANVDDQLLLWIDDKLIDLGGADGGAEYNANAVFGGRENIIPQSTPNDPGDLAPAGVGSRGAALTVKNLRVLRDIYYIADRHDQPRGSDITDLNREVYFDMIGQQNGGVLQRDGYRTYLSDPQFWPELLDRRRFTFRLQEDQFFVLGDNSPSSKDSRLWLNGEKGPVGEVKKPGGPYVERRLLTGKALFVYWPHSWGKVPGTNIPLPFFPNVWDMRLVR